HIDPKGRLTPYDYGQFALIWDSESGIPAPGSLEDLTKAIYERKLIIMDPRTSTPGLGFLAWTQAAFGDAWKDYWKRLAPSVLTMAPGWDSGYGLFTQGEAPLVVSYTTSPAYHKAYESSERYKALAFAGGHPTQVEVAGILKDSRRRQEALKFLDFLISEEAQAILPETQWMYPANFASRLPPSFEVVPKNLPKLEARLRDPEADPEAAAAMIAAVRR
ncbi:MAG TPA: thiamine ABC transporter substrate-binding protein, partial [Rectinemataceae bacterium]